MDTLPIETKLLIVQNMDPQTLLRLCEVNTEFKGLCDDQLLWRELIKRDFGDVDRSFDLMELREYDKYKFLYLSARQERGSISVVVTIPKLLDVRSLRLFKTLNDTGLKYDIPTGAYCQISNDNDINYQDQLGNLIKSDPDNIILKYLTKDDIDYAYQRLEDGGYFDEPEILDEDE